MSLDAYVSAMHARLVAVEGKLGLPSPNPPSLAAAPSGAGVTAFSEFYSDRVLAFVKSSAALGGRGASLGEAVDNAFRELEAILRMAAECKKPSDAAFMSNLTKALNNVQALKVVRDHDNFDNHAKAVAEGIPALGFVNPAMQTPGPFCSDMADASVFWANKVRQEWKAKEGGDAHMQWCKDLDGMWRGLAALVKAEFPTGLAWNAKGKDAGLGAPPAPVAAKSAPAPSASNAAASNVFSELSKIDQSSGKTAGLKTVTKEMKLAAKELPPLQPTESTKPKAKNWDTGGGGPAANVTPVFALQGNKWVVQAQNNAVTTIAADQVSVKNSVYIFGNQGATVVIEGKCNTITIDGCKDTSVVFQDVLALCEVVNSKKVKIQCKGRAPTVSIDKTDGVVVYLSRETVAETKIVASKSSEMNVQFPGATDDDAWIEKVIPEQCVVVLCAGRELTRAGTCTTLSMAPSPPRFQSCTARAGDTAGGRVVTLSLLIKKNNKGLFSYAIVFSEPKQNGHCPRRVHQTSLAQWNRLSTNRARLASPQPFLQARVAVHVNATAGLWSLGFLDEIFAHGARDQLYEVLARHGERAAAPDWIRNRQHRPGVAAPRASKLVQ